MADRLMDLPVDQDTDHPPLRRTRLSPLSAPLSLSLCSLCPCSPNHRPAPPPALTNARPNHSPAPPPALTNRPNQRPLVPFPTP